MEEELVNQFILKFPYMFNEDKWFWENELLILLAQHKAKLYE